MKAAHNLDRSVQFRRASLTLGALEQVQTWADLGAAEPAEVTFMSDGERWQAEQVQAQATARVLVRHSAFTAAVTEADRLIYEGEEYEIVAHKPIGDRNAWREFTVARVVARG